MTMIAYIRTVCFAFAAFGTITTGTAQAASGSVGVSITFEMAPIDLIGTRDISPSRHRSCEILREKISILWQGRKRPPVVNCRMDAQIPLIVTSSTSKGALVARP